MEALVSTNFNFRDQKSFYRGKVRDVYNIGNKFLAMVACDRISAFDVVLPRPIPYKGQVLNQIATHFLDLTKNIVPNWKIANPDANVTIGYLCEPIKIEMVIRGYLSGHAWRTYKSGLREVCGEEMKNGLKENDRFNTPIITPTIKADSGHDEDVSRDDILKNNLVDEEIYVQLENYTKALYEFGSDYAAKQGLILVDTKYEFGIKDGEIMLMDEIHTPDSSRYFYLDTYEKIQSEDQQQKQLSKEFVRQWLIQNGFKGDTGQVPPHMTDEYVNSVTTRYIELYEKITALKFEKANYKAVNERIEKAISDSLESIK